MSIFKVNPSDFQSISVATNPSRYYSSSSAGLTGSVYVFARRSSVEKLFESTDDPDSPFFEAKLYNTWVNLVGSVTKGVDLGKTEFYETFDEYLSDVNSDPASQKKQKTIEVSRFVPPFYFTTGTLKKAAIKDNLGAYYRAQYPSSHWAYSNYHSLNFFSSSTVPTSSVLLYPNDDDGTIHEGYASGRYALSGAFSFDFYINPRYNKLDANGEFKAGTIFHLSSSYALSLVTGSRKDINGLPATFRLQLQLSHSADISPSLAAPGGLPNNLTFLSDDNSLLWNNWHHVVIRWGTDLVNYGTGSFNINGVDKGTFVVPSGTVAPLAYASTATDPANPDVLCVGNYYEGTNTGNDRLKRFFSVGPSLREGLYRLDATSNINGPSTFKFDHPLQAELHDLSIKRFYVTDADIIASSSMGLSNTKDVSFYLPPFFVPYSSIKTKSTYGGVLQTPAYEASGMTTTPLNTTMAFGVAGHYINTENFLKDFASNHFPRQMFLSGTKVDFDSNPNKLANEILYDQPAVRRRNLLILPCDDGNFYPNYDLLTTGTIKVLNPVLGNSYVNFSINPDKVSYVDDLGTTSRGFITLNNFLTASSLLSLVDIQKFEDGKFVDKTFEEIDNEENEQIKGNIGFYPQYPTGQPRAAFLNYINNIEKVVSDPVEYVDAANRFFVTQSLAPLSTIYKTQDSSSNQVVFFDISNIYYGTRILPGTFSITDSAMTGSGGAVDITIKDDGNGVLYRADSLSPNCTWNSVGTIFYNEGIIAIKSPHLYFFGQHQYEMSFKGEQNIHVLRLESIAPTNYLNSSSNPSFKSIPSTLNPNEPDSDFVYVTGINYHDDNLNVIMKTQLAQPIMKRNTEKLLFKVKYDF